MAKAKRFREEEWLKKMFNIRTVIIEVKPGETEEEAWGRHLIDSPGDLYANIRIFHRARQGLAANLSSP